MRAEAAVLDDWERFKIVDRGDGKVALETFHNLYLSARQGGDALVIAPIIDDWEEFTMTRYSAVGGDDEDEDDEIDEGIEPDPSLEVYSDLCEFQEMSGGREGRERRGPVFVKLWEWNYVDIARECREYLGPNGFDAVQLSPVVEHMRGHQWWTKYQPISFGLETRSGTAAEFKEMVAECRAAGVQVIVDAILNHMGGGCHEAYHSSEPICVGWNGSHYGNRQMSGSRGWDAATPDYFRHAPHDKFAGVCGVGPPAFLCGSLVTTDCSCCHCDLYGMPDWNTGLHEVRAIHYRHVKELHDAGVTMLRIDAALYENVTETASVLNQFPWDYVYMEWWGEYPVGIHDQYIGNYRDVALRWKITNRLASEKNLSKFPEVLDINYGTFGVDNHKTIYPMAFHDQRTPEADQEIATYKNGLEYHQQQKFLLAWPWPDRVLLWGGFGWTDGEQGPPGCNPGHDTCRPTSVFGGPNGEAQCLDTPTEAPLPDELAQSRRWVCEHRWAGVAGLVGFRGACRGRETTVLPNTGAGRLAFTADGECLVAMVKGTNNRWPQGYGKLGDWSLRGLKVGLPFGRYCDVAQLSTRFTAGVTHCDSEVFVNAAGVIVKGTVREGDLLAIYTGARIQGHSDKEEAETVEAEPQPLQRRLRAGKGTSSS